MHDRPRPEHPPLDDDTRRALIDRLNQINGDRFGGHLGYRLVDVRKGWARIEVESTQRLMNPSGVMHGGASFGLADSAVAAALLTIYGPGNALLTIEMKINYLEAVEGGTVAAEAEVVRRGRHIAVVDCDLYSDDRRLVGKALMTFFVGPFQKNRKTRAR